MSTIERTLQHLRDLYEAADYAACRFVAGRLIAADPEVPEHRAEVFYMLGNLDEIDRREGDALDRWVTALAQRRRPDSSPEHPIYESTEQAIRGLCAAPHIFVSYSSEDADLANELRDHIESQSGLTCIDFRRDFPASGTVSGTIADGLSLASCIVVVWSSSHTKSAYCAAELAACVRKRKRGLSRHRLFIVTADSTPVPVAARDWIRSDATEETVVRIATKIVRTIGQSGAIAAPARAAKWFLRVCRS